MILVDASVAGRPKTKGSLVFVAPGYAKDSEASRHWRALMAGAVRDSVIRLHAERTCTGPRGGCSHPTFLPCGRRPEAYAGPVCVRLTALLPVDPLAQRAGDLDKLARNVLDALDVRSRNPRLRGGAIVDDNQVVDLRALKAGPSDWPGVSIMVTTIDDVPPPLASVPHRC